MDTYTELFFVRLYRSVCAVYGGDVANVVSSMYGACVYKQSILSAREALRIYRLSPYRKIAYRIVAKSKELDFISTDEMEIELKKLSLG